MAWILQLWEQPTESQGRHKAESKRQQVELPYLYSFCGHEAAPLVDTNEYVPVILGRGVYSPTDVPGL